jgi:hypothetical protein
MKFYIKYKKLVPLSGWFPVTDVYTDRAEWISAYRAMLDDRTVKIESVRMVAL